MPISSETVFNCYPLLMILSMISIRLSSSMILYLFLRFFIAYQLIFQFNQYILQPTKLIQFLITDNYYGKIQYICCFSSFYLLCFVLFLYFLMITNILPAYYQNVILKLQALKYLFISIIIRFHLILLPKIKDKAYNNRIMINKISGAKRLTGFDKPTVWSIMTPLAIKTKSVNLGQGFPSWSPPDFYLQHLDKSQKQSQHQYTRAFGSLPLVQAIAKFHKRFPKIDPENQIVTVNGGVEGLFSCIIALIDEGDQVMFFDPSYDCYRAQIQMAGGRSVGLPLKPKHQQTKTMIKQRCKEKYVSEQADQWQIDFQSFQKHLNEKTKMFILNSPHNPVGKVFTEAQLQKLSKILQKYPRVVVVEDNVYEGMTFDDMFSKELPKMAFQQGMYDRTLSVYSAGKIFAATGVRSGWVIGNANLIKAVRSVHQYNVFCAYNVVQNTIAKSLQTISHPQNTYMRQYAQKLTKNRNILLDELLASKFDFDLWIPKGGYFVIADISRVQVQQKYYNDEEGNKRTKDYAFCIQLAHEQGVVAIPCSAFYSKEDKHLGQKYVRFAFCKDQSMIRQAGQRMRTK